MLGFYRCLPLIFGGQLSSQRIRLSLDILETRHIHPESEKKVPKCLYHEASLPQSPISTWIASDFSRCSRALSYWPSDVNNDPSSKLHKASPFLLSISMLIASAFSRYSWASKFLPNDWNSVPRFLKHDASLSIANFDDDSECFLQILSGLVILTKRFERCSSVYVAWSFSISVGNFYADGKCFIQILSGLVMLTKWLEQWS